MKTPRLAKLAAIVAIALASALPIAAQTPAFTEFRFMSENIGWEDDLVGTIDNEANTVTFTTQKWIENIAELSAVFELNGDYEVKVGEILQQSGVTTNDFRKDAIYRINDEIDYTIKFVSPQASGLPVVRIDTKDGAPILDKENYVNMTFALTDVNNPDNDITVVNNENGIRGRGNSTWFDTQKFTKRPYRIKFDKKQSLFGLVAAKSWVLLAEVQDPTFLITPTVFELGREVFEFPYTCTYQHVQVYLNGRYDGVYGLTEHRQADPNEIGAPGRVKVDLNDGWLVEVVYIDYYNEKHEKLYAPKFRTTHYNLPTVIKSPEFTGVADMTNPAYEFVRTDWNELCDSLASAGFPENGYRNLIDMNSIVDYLMIQDIVYNPELQHPTSVFAYKDKGQKINMGPLWDFDWAFSHDGNHGFFGTYSGNPPKHAFFWRFYSDPIFRVKYKERWNEKYSEIMDVSKFIKTLGDTIRIAVLEDTKRWNIPGGGGYWTGYDPDHDRQTKKMVDWWDKRTAWLNTELNKVEVLPGSKTFAEQTFGYTQEISPQKFTLVAYGDMENLSVAFKKAGTSDFEISTQLSKTSTENGGYLATISVKPKMSLSAATYIDTLILSGSNQGKSFSLSIPLNFVVNENTTVSVLTPDRVVPAVKPDEEVTVIAPIAALTGEFTAGPNPISKQSGIVNFYRQGKRVNNSELRIYDVTGNIINKVKIKDNAIATQSRRKVGTWDLCDKTSRTVSAGTYLVRGIIMLPNGNKEKVSIILSVR
jgi:hypothetical protein